MNQLNWKETVNVFWPVLKNKPLTTYSTIHIISKSIWLQTAKFCLLHQTEAPDPLSESTELRQNREGLWPIIKNEHLPKCPLIHIISENIRRIADGITLMIEQWSGCLQGALCANSSIKFTIFGGFSHYWNAQILNLNNGKYMMKMTDPENKLLRSILPHYFRRCASNPKKIMRLLSIYKVKRISVTQQPPLMILSPTKPYQQHSLQRLSPANPSPKLHIPPTTPTNPILFWHLLHQLPTLWSSHHHISYKDFFTPTWTN